MKGVKRSSYCEHPFKVSVTRSGKERAIHRQPTLALDVFLLRFGGVIRTKNMNGYMA